MDGWRCWLLTKDNRRKSFGARILRDGGITVTEQNNRDIVVWKTIHFSDEARAATFAGHYAMPEAFADEPAIAIAWALDEVLLAGGRFRAGSSFRGGAEREGGATGGEKRAV